MKHLNKNIRASLKTQVPNIKFQMAKPSLGTMIKSQMFNDRKNDFFEVCFFIIGICLLFVICDLEFLEIPISIQISQPYFYQ